MDNNTYVRVFLAGDSTVQTYSADWAPQAGWGQFIQDYFLSNVEFLNHAIGGRSSRSFVEEGRLDRIFEVIRPGDYLFIQMGHNDATQNKPERYTDPRTTYPAYLMRYVDGARERGAMPILITPVARLHVTDHGFVNDFPEYCESMKRVAVERDVPLIDLMSRSLCLYDRVGLDRALQYFMASVNHTDHTHFTETGANAIARLVAQGVRDLPVSLATHVAVTA